MTTGSERDLLTRRSMLRVSAGGLAVLLAGCSAAKSSRPGNSGGGQASNNLVFGTVTDLDPQDFLRTGTNTATQSLIFDTLANLDPTTRKPTPSVATSWTWNADKTELTVNLRDDVRYHTGRKLGPEDVIFSIKAEQNPTSGAQIGATALQIESMRATGPSQLKLKIRQPMSNFENLLILTPLIDRETFSGLYSAKKVVGTGPFRFDSWTPGTSIDLSRNPHYWQAGLPHVDSVRIRVFGSEQALVSALRTSEIDLAWDLVPADAELLTKSNGFQSLTTSPAFSEWYVGVNVKSKPFDDVRIRQAIAYALDRNRIVKQAFSGYGQVSCLPWQATLPGLTAADATYYRYDPARAKALLKQAGASGLTVPILTGAGNVIAEAILNIVQFNLSAVGLKVKPEQVQATAFQKQLQAASVPGLWINDVGQSYLSVGTVLLGNAPFKITKNTSNVTDPHYIALAKKLIFADTPAAQSSATRALTQYMLQEAWHITVGHTPTVSAAAKDLVGVETSGGGGIDLSSARLT